MRVSGRPVTACNYKNGGRPPLYRSTELTTKSPPCEGGILKNFDFTTPSSPPCEGGERGVVISSTLNFWKFQCYIIVARDLSRLKRLKGNQQK